MKMYSKPYEHILNSIFLTCIILLTLSTQKGLAANIGRQHPSFKSNPGMCPQGFRPVTPPLNPALGCLPKNFYIQTTSFGRLALPPGGCPSGWKPVTPPLNPILICLPDTIVSVPLEPTDTVEENDLQFRSAIGKRPTVDRRCPKRWTAIVDNRRKRVLVCLPKRIVRALPPGPPPGDCPEGWKPVEDPVNPVLVCLPNTLITP